MDERVRMGSMWSVRRLCGVAVLAYAGTCGAHHSFSMFDRTTTVTLQGTVKEFQWTNPHCFIQLLVPSPDGPEEWSIEMHSPAAIYRRGWRPGTLKGGEKVTIVMHPVRDGTRGGQIVSATDANGRTLYIERTNP